MNSIIDHIWIALPRDTYNAADTEVEFVGGPEAPGYGIYIWSYVGEFTEEEGYFPDIGYIGRLTIQGEDGVMSLIRHECYDFLTLRDQFPPGVTDISGDMDLKWKMQGGLDGGIGLPDPGAVTAGSRLGGVVDTLARRPFGRRR